MMMMTKLTGNWRKAASSSSFGDSTLLEKDEDRSSSSSSWYGNDDDHDLIITITMMISPGMDRSEEIGDRLIMMIRGFGSRGRIEEAVFLHLLMIMMMIMMITITMMIKYRGN